MLDEEVLRAGKTHAPDPFRLEQPANLREYSVRQPIIGFR